MATCAGCGTENTPAAKFCEGCGTPLARSCPACGATPSGTARFCPECGTALGGTVGEAPATASRPLPQAPPVSERRLVTVLFVDLVGFTTLAQSRDPEDVRELLSRYFEACSSLVERYGGVVEKFIGDAVMAVWGAPIAQEDDAERAVRTALDIVDAVGVLGDEIGAQRLAARAGVLTGEAAVTIGAKGQGMVAGDLVNTASRIQSIAEPGTVLVGDSTRRTTEVPIAYEDAGVHRLKGKDEALQLYRALRVVAGLGGLMKSERIEPPFVGRARELKVVKELFHASTEARRAQLVQVTGIAGIGKSRLVWEFFKYMDGLRSLYMWHRGRCLAYGEGVTYWALAEMVRGRLGILEGEDRSSAWEKLHRALDEYLPDSEDRRFVEPRLAQLIGLEDRSTSNRQELFSAWRLFFERLTDQSPVIMVFEDMQWADPSLLEFLGHLLERSRNYPIFVMALARPETAAASLGATQRNATFIHLEPLSSEEMRELLAGFAPGLPDDLTDRILERAEGVPLYAVETVRMLLDRGLLVQEGPVYRPTGTIGSLEVPESLHALIAARLDGLLADERRVVQTASVLGKSFTRQSLAALTQSDDDGLDGVLASLVAKEVLTIHADPRSSERGQYGFVQDLMRTVSHETLSRHDRRRLHLDAASYLESAWGGDEDEEEIVEVVASHLLEAWRLDETADDAPGIKARAKAMLVRAGDRAGSLGAPLEASGYYEQAASLSDDGLERAELTNRTGRMASIAGHADEAIEYFDRASAMFAEAGDDHRAALSQARLASSEHWVGRLDAALERMTAARAVMAGSAPDESLATVTAQLGRFLALGGRHDEALPVLEEALELAEHLALPEVFAEALNSRAILLSFQGRLDEAHGLLRQALDVALEHDLNSTALRSYLNLQVLLDALDRDADGLELSGAGAALARRVGAISLESELRAGTAGFAASVGRWDEALEAIRSVEAAGVEAGDRARSQLLGVMPVLVARGDLDQARRLLDAAAGTESSEQADVRAAFAEAKAEVLRATGELNESLGAAESAVAARDALSLTNKLVKRSLVLAIDVALELGDVDKADALLGIVECALPGEVTPWLRAHYARLRARADSSRSPQADVDHGFATAEEGFRRLGLPLDLAVTLLEHAEWRAGAGRRDDSAPLLDEATEIFDRLDASTWVDRAQELAASLGQNSEVLGAR